MTNRLLDEQVAGFAPTRYELGELAKQYLEDAWSVTWFIEVGGCFGSSELGARDRYLARLAAIQKVLGEKDYAEATSGIDDKWEKRFADFKEEEQICPNDHRRQSHEDCVLLAAENTSPLLGRFPRMSEDHARQIYDRKPFIGMTLEQAEIAVGCLVHNRTSPSTEAGEEETWLVSKQAWGTRNRARLTFVDRRIVSIEDVSCRSDEDPVEDL